LLTLQADPMCLKKRPTFDLLDTYIVQKHKLFEVA